MLHVRKPSEPSKKKSMNLFLNAIACQSFFIGSCIVERKKAKEKTFGENDSEKKGKKGE